MNIGSNAGHTLKGKGSGAIGLVDESICTRQINNYFMKGLAAKGISVHNCSIDYSKEYLYQAVKMANKLNLDYAISHHLNHSDDSSANGVEVWIHDLENKETYDLAYNICHELSKLGFRNRGVKVSNKLYWLKNTVSEAILIEYCFCSNVKDTNLYNPQKLAQASINAIIYNINKKVV